MTRLQKPITYFYRNACITRSS